SARQLSAQPLIHSQLHRKLAIPHDPPAGFSAFFALCCDRRRLKFDRARYLRSDLACRSKNRFVRYPTQQIGRRKYREALNAAGARRKKSQRITQKCADKSRKNIIEAPYNYRTSGMYKKWLAAHASGGESEATST